MDLSTSSVKHEVVADYREILYYGKYRYRARFFMRGLQYTWGIKDIDQYQRRLKNVRGVYNDTKFKDIDLNQINNFLHWRNEHSQDKTVTIRVEGNHASVFSNDLNLLFTLENIVDNLDYLSFSEVNEIAPLGVKYFEKEPKHKFRAYLKSKRVKDSFKSEMSEFLNRYKGTQTVLKPSKAFRQWLSGSKFYGWNRTYSSSHYYIEYDDESTDSLLALMFGDMIKRRYKLEQRKLP